MSPTPSKPAPPPIGTLITANRIARIRTTQADHSFHVMEHYGRSDRCGPAEYYIDRKDLERWTLIQRMSTDSLQWWVTNELLTGQIIGRGWRQAGTIEPGDYDTGGDYWAPTGATMQVYYVVNHIDEAKPKMVLA